MTPCKVTIDYDGPDITDQVVGKTLRITLASGKTIHVECFERSHELGIAIGCADWPIVVFPEASNRVRRKSSKSLS